MKTLLFTTIIFFIVQTKENCGDYYRYTALSSGQTYVICSNTNYDIKDTIYLKK